MEEEVNNYPLFPELPEEAKMAAQELINSFKSELKKAVYGAAEEAIGELYSDILPYIESDTWHNFRSQIVDGLSDYNNRTIQGAWDFKKIRSAIYKEHRADIIADLNQDMVEEIAELKKQIARLEGALESSRGR
jgi:hypothetical protein